MKSYVIRRRFNPSLTTGSESVKIFLPKGFTNKLINLIQKDDKGQRFRYPKK